MFDPNSLMYVTKEYENTLRDKAKKIYADDVVKTTLDSVNKELDSILLQINDRLDEISNKSTEIDVYRADVHRFIDQTSINPQELMDENITNTKSHPSIIANKQDRSKTQTYTYNNFINQKIELSSFLDVNINEGRMNSDKNVHSFDIALSSEETLKVVEFAITYKQKPTIIHKMTNGTIEDSEDTVVVNRVFSGRFYIIRPDIINNPDQIVVKAVVENADNDANNKDVKILDVRSMKATDGKSVEYLSNIGPEFDLYFFTHSIDTITICIGNILPYRWLLQKDSYISGEGEDPTYTDLVTSKLNKKYVGIDYIKSANAYILRDSVNNIYYSLDHTLTNDSIKVLDNIDYDGTNFWIKETSSLTFIHSKESTYVCGTDVTNTRILSVDISDIKEMSTGEIIASVPNLGLITFDKTSSEFEVNPFVTIDGEKYDSSKNDISVVKNDISFIEVNNDKLLVFSTKDGKLQYFFVPINQNTGIYSDFSYASEVVQTTIDRYELSDPQSTRIKLINSPVGIFVLVKTFGNNGNVSTIYNLRDLTINSKSYTYGRFEELKLFKPESNEEYTDYDVVFSKIVDTSIGSFAIDEKNNLYVFDDTYIIKAITTNEVFDENDESVSLGFDDKNSFIKLDSSERIEGQYYKNSTPFLNNVVDIFENTTGIFIVDKYGIYQLTSDLTLKTRYYDKTSKINDICRDENVKKRSLFSSISNDTTSIYEMSDIIKENTDEKLRYKYFDLYNGKYTKYNSETMNNSDYDYDTDNGADNPLVNFDASLYVSLVDLTGSLYNTYSSSNDVITYSKSTYTFSDIDPTTTHNIKFEVDDIQNDGSVIKKEINKTPNTYQFKLQPNKYGFLNYEGFGVENFDSETISNTNSVKKYKFVHTSDDTDISFQDCRNQIENVIKNEIDENISDTTSENKSVKLEYTDTKTYDKYKVRAFPMLSLGHVSSHPKLGTLNNKLVYKNRILVENNGMKGFNSFVKFATVKGIDIDEADYYYGCKTTENGSFIFAKGIMRYIDNDTKFENQLLGYDYSVDGYVNDIVYMNDIRQTYLICCDNSIFAYTSRKEQGYTFSIPLSSSNYTTKLRRPDYTDTECYALDKAVVCGENTYVFNSKPIDSDSKFTLYKVTYDSDSSIKLESVINEGSLSDRYVLDLYQNNNVLWLVTVDSNKSNEIIYSYDLETKKLTKIYQSEDSSKYKYKVNNSYSDNHYNADNETHFVNFVEYGNYIYLASVSGIQKINKETNNFIHVKDDANYGLIKFNNRIYAYSRNTIYKEDKLLLTGNEIISLYNTNNDILESIYIPPVSPNHDTYVNISILNYANTIYNNGGIVIDIVSTNDGVYFTIRFDEGEETYSDIIFQLIDDESKFVGLVPYFNNQKFKYVHKNVTSGDQYYIDINDHYLYKNGIVEKIDNSLFDTDIKLKTLTTDTSPQAGKTYYTIDGNFNELFNITSFDSNIKYYIRSGDPSYTKVDKEKTPSPKRGIEYYSLDIDGKYKFCGYNLTEFNKTIDYYTANYSYKLANTSSFVSGERYFTIEQPTYTAVENIGSSFDSSKDYYEETDTTVVYNVFERSFGTDKGYIIANMSNSDKTKTISVAFDVSTKVKKVLPVTILDLYDTSVGTYVLYSKGNNQTGFGCITNDLEFVFTDISTETSIDSIDLLELDSTKDNLASESKNIFISGNFDNVGKVFKYIPSTTDNWNRFKEVDKSSFGYKGLFNIDNDVYIVVTNSDLMIKKFNVNSTTFEDNYHGRTFDFKQVCHKIDEIGKDDVYLIGVGDYCIYKSYNNTFVPVFENYNSSNFSPDSALSDNEHIYICTSDNQLCVISNNSDEKFVSISSNITTYNYSSNRGNDDERYYLDGISIDLSMCLNEHVNGYYEDENGRICLPTDKGYLYFVDFINETHSIFRQNHVYDPSDEYLYYKYYTDDAYIDDRNNSDITFNWDLTKFKMFTPEVINDLSKAPDINSPHMLDPNINLPPIYTYDKSNIIYTCYDNDINKMIPVGPKQSLYDANGTTIIHHTPKFDMYIDSEYGTFGIQGNEVYLRKRYSESNARWKLINRLKTTDSEFKTIKNTKTLGWILVDDRTVTKFDVETGKFDIDITISDWTNETTTNKVKINYINEFEDSNKLIIAHIADINELWSGKTPNLSGIQVYMKQNNKYQFINVINSNYTSATNPAITSINETSLGVFVVYLTYDYTTHSLTKSNYGNCHSYVFRINDTDNGSVIIDYVGSAPTGYTWSETCYPVDMRQIYESTQDNIIVLTRPAFQRDNNNVSLQLRYWVLVREDINGGSIDDESYINDLGYTLKFYPYSSKTPSLLTTKYPVDTGDESKYYTNDGNIINVNVDGKNYLVEYKDENSFNNTYSIKSCRNNFLGTGTKVETSHSISNQAFDTYFDTSENDTMCGMKFKIINNKCYVLLMYEQDSIYAKLLSYDPSTNSSKVLPENGFIQVSYDYIINNIYENDYDLMISSISKNSDIFEFNGNIFIYLSGKTYIVGSKTLSTVETTEPVFDNKALYELKLTIENKNLYNNLVEKTSNSNIDKFVIREIGVYDKDNVNLNSIHQYFENHAYYNNTDGSKSSDKMLCKEYTEQSSKIYNKLKHRLTPSSDMLLNNNIFLKKDNKVILDMSGRETKSVLGEIEEYINDLSNYKIELMIYPSNVVDNSIDEPVLVNTL